jgi:hypothetical protein
MIFKNHIADKTNWRTMLKGTSDPVDLAAERDRLFNECEAEIAAAQDLYGLQCIQMLNEADEANISYPVLEYPVKIASFNFDKKADVEGTLLGIKGQYLIFDNGVINIRKFSGYHIEFSA